MKDFFSELQFSLPSFSLTFTWPPGFVATIIRSQGPRARVDPRTFLVSFSCDTINGEKDEASIEKIINEKIIKKKKQYCTAFQQLMNPIFVKEKLRRSEKINQFLTLPPPQKKQTNCYCSIVVKLNILVANTRVQNLE